MIIGIIGKARSGKDTFAEMLAKHLSDVFYPPYVTMAFAQELKTRCQKDFDLSYDQLWGDDKEVLDKRYPKQDGAGFWTAREIMQAYGQFYRTIDYDFWVKNLYRVIEDKEYSNVIITDVRHVNEADSVLNHGGYLIKVVRENAPKVHGEQHISETALDNYDKVDFAVLNNWGLEELEQTAKDVIRFLQDSEDELKRIKEKTNG